MRKQEWKMSVMKLLMAISFVFCLCIANEQSVHAETTTYQLGDNVTGVLASDGTLTVSGTGEMYDYTADTTSGTSPLYNHSGIKKVIVKDGVTSVGCHAFEKCYYIAEVDIAGSVKVVGDSAFCWDNGIRSVVLREGIEELGMFCFGHTYNLTTVEFAQSIKTIGVSAFYGCYKLEDVTLPDSLETIGMYAFGACVSITELEIPASVQKLSGPIFGACSNVMGDREYALNDVYVASGNAVYQSIDGVVYSKDGTKIVWYPDGRKEKNYTVQDGTTEISKYALANEYLEKIRLPDTVTVIGESAFAGAYKLKSLNLPEHVTTIGAGAFEACWLLDDIVVPKSVTYIGYWAFAKCIDLHNITILNPNVRIQRATINGGELSDYIFYQCPEELAVHTCEGSTIDTYMDEFTDGNRVYDLELGAVMNVAYRTEEEIRAYLSEHPVSIDTEVTYTEAPVTTAPYAAGALSNETTTSALNTVNAMRYIAGIDGEVTIDDDYMEQAQAAALVNASNCSMSHYPSQPQGMDDTLYELGYNGAGKSNLAGGYSNLNEAIINGWMGDSDPSNIGRVGHRRWVLNPAMEKTGFGVCEGYYAMYALNEENSAADTHGVAWPAQTMPVEYFSTEDAWSISIGTSVDENSVQVKLTNTNTGKSWRFSSDSSDGDFYVINDYYGQIGCIIFRPDDIVDYSAGERYRVEISGIGAAGLKSSVTYEVEFFTLNPEAEIGGSGTTGGNGATGGDAENGLIQGTDGNWYYYTNGTVNTSYTGLVYDVNVGWWYVENGRINFDYNGLIYYNGAWWCVAGGQVRFDYTGLWSDPYVGWWYVTGGAIDFNASGLVQNEYGWWCVNGGAVDFGYTGLAYDANVGWWYVNGGAIDFNASGLVYYNEGWYCVNGGMLDWGYTGLAYDANVGWWYVNGGVIDFGACGLAPYGDSWYYVNGGMLDWGYTGPVDWNGGTYNVVNGVVVF